MFFVLVALQTTLTGVGIEVWAYRGSWETYAPIISCTLDGIDQDSQSPPQSSAADEWLDWRIIYNSGLSKGNHTLQCDVVEASPEAPFRLSSFGLYSNELQQLLGGENLASDGQSNTTTDPTATHTSTATSSDIPTGSEAATPDGSAASSKATFPTGAVVGGTIGGVVFGVILVGALWLLVRRRRSKGRYASVRLDDDDDRA